MKTGLSVLIVGGTGIIGRDLSAAALAAGHRVTVVSRRQRRPVADSVEEIFGDVYDSKALAVALENRRFDVVVDLLSFTPDQLATGLALFLGRCGQYLFVSSATVYEGAGSGAAIVESTPFAAGHWSYPELKIASEERLRSECKRSGQRYTIVRPYITYSDQRIAFGAWEARDILPRLLSARPIVIGGQLASTPTSLTHSRDLARGITGLLGNPEAMDEDFHIASEDAITWGEVHQVAADIVGQPLSLVTVQEERVAHIFPELMGKIADRLLPRIFDNAKLKAAIPGFAFQHSVRDGYAELIPQILKAGISADLSTQGRMDRLFSEQTPFRSEGRAFARRLIRESPVDYLRYASGRYPLVAAAKRLRRAAKTESPYGARRSTDPRGDLSEHGRQSRGSGA